MVINKKKDPRIINEYKKILKYKKISARFDEFILNYLETCSVI